MMGTQSNHTASLFLSLFFFPTREIKKELLPFGTARTEPESIMLSEISQAVRDKYHMIALLLS